jgi:hypothetical protein
MWTDRPPAEPDKVIAANGSGCLRILKSREVLEGMHLGSLPPEQEKPTYFLKFCLFK